MASWAALNAGVTRGLRSGDDEDPGTTEEAQETINAALYEKALRLQHQKQGDSAKAIYLQLLSSDGGLSARLRYLCNRNAAALEVQDEDLDAALVHFANVCSLSEGG